MLKAGVGRGWPSWAERAIPLGPPLGSSGLVSSVNRHRKLRLVGACPCLCRQVLPSDGAEQEAVGRQGEKPRGRWVWRPPPEPWHAVLPAGATHLCSTLPPGFCGAPSLTHFGLLGWAPSLLSFSWSSAVISTNKSDHGYSDVGVTLMLARLGPVSEPSGAWAPSHVPGCTDCHLLPSP